MELKTGITNLSETTYPGGTVVRHFISRDNDNERIKNGYDRIDSVKSVKLSEKSKLRELGVDTIEYKKSYELHPGAYWGKIGQPCRENLKEDSLWPKSMNFWAKGENGYKEHLKWINMEPGWKDEIKKFYECLKQIKQYKMPLNHDTVNCLMKLMH